MGASVDPTSWAGMIAPAIEDRGKRPYWRPLIGAPMAEWLAYYFRDSWTDIAPMHRRAGTLADAMSAYYAAPNNIMNLIEIATIILKSPGIICNHLIA